MDENYDHVTARIFTGVLVTSEVRMHLNQSNAWKNATITAAHGSDDLTELRHDKTDYIGCYINEDKVLLNELKRYEQFVLGKLLTYCPRLPKTSCQFQIFTQILVQ